jgi:hypothetical protein
MSNNGNGTAVLERPLGDFEIEADDVTGYQRLTVPLSAPGGRGLPLTAPASAVARALADRMRLPDDVSYALRDENSGAFLDENRPIGDQVRPGSRVTMTPKAHLGAP